MTLPFSGPVLCFFAHPDDETLGAGGTIRRLVREGLEVHVAIAATGITSRGAEGAEEKIAALHRDCVKACSLLGVPEISVIFGNFPDNAMDSVPQLAVNKWVEALCSSIAPRTLITHHIGCTNIDHRICHEAAVVATRPTSCHHIALLSAEIPSSTGYRRPAGFEPNFYVALDDADMEAKINAMQCYYGESEPDPHPRSPEVLRAFGKVRGSEAGTLLAEGFMLIRGVF